MGLGQDLGQKEKGQKRDHEDKDKDKDKAQKNNKYGNNGNNKNRNRGVVLEIDGPSHFETYVLMSIMLIGLIELIVLI